MAFRKKILVSVFTLHCSHLAALSMEIECPEVSRWRTLLGYLDNPSSAGLSFAEELDAREFAHQVGALFPGRDSSDAPSIFVLSKMSSFGRRAFQDLFNKLFPEGSNSPEGRLSIAALLKMEDHERSKVVDEVSSFVPVEASSGGHRGTSIAALLKMCGYRRQQFMEDVDRFFPKKGALMRSRYSVDDPVAKGYFIANLSTMDERERQALIGKIYKLMPEGIGSPERASFLIGLSEMTADERDEFERQICALFSLQGSRSRDTATLILLKMNAEERGRVIGQIRGFIPEGANDSYKSIAIVELLKMNAEERAGVIGQINGFIPEGADSADRGFAIAKLSEMNAEERAGIIGQIRGFIPEGADDSHKSTAILALLKMNAEQRAGIIGQINGFIPEGADSTDRGFAIAELSKMNAEERARLIEQIEEFIPEESPHHKGSHIVAFLKVTASERGGVISQISKLTKLGIPSFDKGIAINRLLTMPAPQRVVVMGQIDALISACNKQHIYPADMEIAINKLLDDKEDAFIAEVNEFLPEGDYKGLSIFGLSKMTDEERREFIQQALEISPKCQMGTILALLDVGQSERAGVLKQIAEFMPTKVSSVHRDISVAALCRMTADERMAFIGKINKLVPEGVSSAHKELAISGLSPMGEGYVDAFVACVNDLFPAEVDAADKGDCIATLIRMMAPEREDFVARIKQWTSVEARNTVVVKLLRMTSDQMKEAVGEIDRLVQRGCSPKIQSVISELFRMSDDARREMIREILLLAPSWGGTSENRESSVVTLFKMTPEERGAFKGQIQLFFPTRDCSPDRDIPVVFLLRMTPEERGVFMDQIKELIPEGANPVDKRFCFTHLSKMTPEKRGVFMDQIKELTPADSVAQGRLIVELLVMNNDKRRAYIDERKASIADPKGDLAS